MHEAAAYGATQMQEPASAADVDDSVKTGAYISAGSRHTLMFALMNSDESIPNLTRLFIAIGAVSACLAVGLGAFGAHALRAETARTLSLWHTAVQYHLFHSLGLLVIGALTMRMRGTRLLHWAGWAMLTGVFLFSGSLYALALSGPSALGMVTPVGGVFMLIAWALLAFAAMRSI